MKPVPKALFLTSSSEENAVKSAVGIYHQEGEAFSHPLFKREHGTKYLYRSEKKGTWTVSMHDDDNDDD